MVDGKCLRPGTKVRLVNPGGAPPGLTRVVQDPAVTDAPRPSERCPGGQFRPSSEIPDILVEWPVEWGRPGLGPPRLPDRPAMSRRRRRGHDVLIVLLVAAFAVLSAAVWLEPTCSSWPVSRS
jgi:hypothetical protein